MGLLNTPKVALAKAKHTSCQDDDGALTTRARCMLDQTCRHLLADWCLSCIIGGIRVCVSPQH